MNETPTSDSPEYQAEVELERQLRAAIDEDNAAVEYDPPRAWMRPYLVALAVTGIQTQAAERVGISDQSVIAWKQRDEKFALACHRAKERADDRLEETVRAWATVGLEVRTTETKTLPDGTRVVTERVARERSPALAKLLLEGNRPEKFRRQLRVEQSGPGGRPIEHEVTLVEQTVAAFYEELERLGSEA